MKQTLSIFLLSIFLVGCSAIAAPNNEVPTEKTEKPDQTESNENNQANQQENLNTIENYQPNPQVTEDRTLKQVGQSYADGKGEATLKAINHVNQTYKVGSIELTIKEMKWIHLRPDYSMIDYFHVLTHEEEFDFVKVFVEIKNTSDKNLNFAPIALIKTNTGETIDWEKDIYLEELNGEIEGNSTKFGNLGFIINSTDTDEHTDEHSEDDNREDIPNESKDIKWIEIMTSDVFDQNKEKISDAQKIKIEF